MGHSNCECHLAARAESIFSAAIAMSAAAAWQLCSFTDRKLEIAMTDRNSVAAIYDTHEQAEQAVKS
jgi:hypothetical protein